MTESRKLVRAKLSLRGLGDLLNNVSRACWVVGVSRQHFHDIKSTQEEGGIDALRAQNRRRPFLEKRVSHEVEDAIAALADGFPAYGQV